MLMIEREGGMPSPRSRVAIPHLRAWRLQRLMTQDELARAAGLGEATVPRAEAGNPVNALTAARLAKALKVTVKQLTSEPPEGSA